METLRRKGETPLETFAKAHFAQLMMNGNVPAEVRRIVWVRTLQQAMMATSKGHRLNAIRHTGKTYWVGDDFVVDRRKDKLVPRLPKALRQWNARTGRSALEE